MELYNIGCGGRRPRTGTDLPGMITVGALTAARRRPIRYASMINIFIILALLGGVSHASPKPKPNAPFYSVWVQKLTSGQGQMPGEALFVGNHVKKPGVYEFQEGVTISSAVRLAGGLDLKRFTSSAGTSWIMVYRKSTEKPEGFQAVSCRLNMGHGPVFDLPNCKQRLKAGDLVLVDWGAQFILP